MDRAAVAALFAFFAAMSERGADRLVGRAEEAYERQLMSYDIYH